jgi:hypothetical protein
MHSAGTEKNLKNRIKVFSEPYDKANNKTDYLCESPA